MLANQDPRPVADANESAIRAVAHALAEAEDPSSLLQSIAETAQQAVRATAAYVEQLSTENQSVVIAAATGKGVPPVGTSVPYPGSLTEELIARGAVAEPEIVEDLTEQARPIGEILRETCGARSALIIPLRSSASLYGVLAVLRPRAESQFGAEDAAQLRLIADMASIAFKRADMIEKLKVETDLLRRSEQRTRLVAEIGRLLGSSLDYEETLNQAARLLLPAFADWCTIDLLEPRGTGIRRIALTHGDAAHAAYAEELQRRYAPTARHRTNARDVITTGEPKLWREIPPELVKQSAHDARHAQILESLGMVSAISVPITVRDKILGAISLMSAKPERRYDEADLRFAIAFGERAGVAIENARLHTSVLESTNRLQETLDRVGDGFFAFDRDWRLAYANPVAERLLVQLLGTGTKSLTGVSLWTAVPQLVGTSFERVLREAMEEQRPTHIEEFFEPGGAWLESFMYPSSTGVSVFARDVTERRRTQSAVAILAEIGSRVASATDYATTLEEITRAVVPSFADYATIDLASNGFERAAYAHRDAAGRSALERTSEFSVNPESPLSEPYRTGRPLLVDVRRTGLDSLAQTPKHRAALEELGPHSIIVTPLIARASMLGLMILARTHASKQPYSASDLELAAELGRRAGSAVDKARLQRDLERAVRGRDDVLAVVAHDLRSPVATIATSASLMQELDLSDAEREKQLGVIRRATERAGRLITDLLDVAQIDAGTLALDRKSLDPVGLIREVCELFEPVAADHGMVLESCANEQLPPILADHDRIIQVFSNLIGNAIKFSSPAGRISVGAEQRASEVALTVADTGRGISSDELPHVFDRFWHTKRGGGAGLGLAIVKGIVEAHGGRIKVESTAGNGARFVFTLPRA